MKNHWNLAALICAVTHCFAKTPQQPYQIQAGAGYSYFEYKVGNKEKKSSNLLSYDAAFTYQATNGIFCQALVKGASSVNNDSSKVLQISAEEKVGYSMGFYADEYIFNVNSGLGYFYFFNKDACHQIKYKNQFNDFYAILGFDFLFQYNNFLQTGFLFQWNPQVFATLSNYLENDMYWKCHNQLNNFRGEIPFNFSFLSSKKLVLQIAIFAEYWQQGESIALTKLLKPLPQRDLLFIGTNLNLQWNF